MFTLLFHVRMDAVKKKKADCKLRLSLLPPLSYITAVLQKIHERVSRARLTREIGERLTLIEPVSGGIYEAHREKTKPSWDL